MKAKAALKPTGAGNNLPESGNPVKSRGVDEIRAELARKIAERTAVEGDNSTAISSLRLYRRSVTTACASAAYEPSLVVFLQGQKRINVGKTIYICDGQNFLLTSVDLPVVSQVIAATEKEPLLGLILKLEMPAVREILSQHEFHLDRNPPTPAPWPSASAHASCSTHVVASSTCSTRLKTSLSSAA